MSSSPRVFGSAAERRGWAFGLLGVMIFALTGPMTRLAVGPGADAQLPPLFVTAGRAALAGLLSAVYLAWTRAPWPRARQLGPIGVCAAGTVFGFPLFLGWAMREVEAVHAAVITGVLPLATAVVASLVFRQRASWGFWGCALLGAAVVLAYAVRAGGGWRWADGWLLLAMGSAAVGYVAGVRLSSETTPEQAICWVLVASLPVTLPLAAWAWPTATARASAWGAFAYLAVFSMWLGFFAWYRGLALGGSLRVSQVQVLQPFGSMLLAVPLLGEQLSGEAVAFLLMAMLTVVVGRRMPVGESRRPASVSIARPEDAP